MNKPWAIACIVGGWISIDNSVVFEVDWVSSMKSLELVMKKGFDWWWRTRERGILRWWCALKENELTLSPSSNIMMRRRLIRPIELESSSSIILILMGFTLCMFVHNKRNVLVWSSGVMRLHFGYFGRPPMTIVHMKLRMSHLPSVHLIIWMQWQLWLLLPTAPNILQRTPQKDDVHSILPLWFLRYLPGRDKRRMV